MKEKILFCNEEKKFSLKNAAPKDILFLKEKEKRVTYRKITSLKRSHKGEDLHFPDDWDEERERGTWSWAQSLYLFEIVVISKKVLCYYWWLEFESEKKNKLSTLKFTLLTGINDFLRV